MAKSAASKATLTAYCMKTKEKNVPIQNAVVSLKNGRYIASGDDGKGNKLTSILGKDKAEAAIASGEAKKGEGFESAAPAKKKK